MASLFVIQGRDQGTRFDVLDEIMSVGRDPSNGVRLHDTEVSRRHAEIRRVLRAEPPAVEEAGETYEWVDLTSSNGSFVNSVRVDRQVLRSGDRVQVGRTLMIYTDTPLAQVQRLASRDVDIVGQVDDWADSQIVHARRPDEGPLLIAGLGGRIDSWSTDAPNNVQIVYRAALAISHTLDIDELLQRIMDLIFEGIEADRGCIMLVDRESDELVPKVRRDRHDRDARRPLTISRTILDYVRTHREGILTTNARDDTRWDPAASIVKLGVREAICVPMQGRYGIVGAIYIDTFTPPVDRLQHPDAPQKFTEDHLQLMVAIAHQAALAIEDTSYYSALVQAERLAVMGQTIAGLSHHVKNILQGMRGGGYLIQEGLKHRDWEVAQRGWEIVDKNQDRISTLVMDMLTFSKEREPELMPSDLNEVVGDVLELMEHRAASLQVTLVDRRSPAIPLMTFDPDGLHRAVLNVVTNAIDACAEATDRVASAEDDDLDDAVNDHEPRPLDRITAAPTSDDDRARDGDVTPKARSVEVSTDYDLDTRKLSVIVRDQGDGIPPEQLKRIFTMFVSSKGQRGTGLGLAVSQKIIQEHGGQIVVSSEVGKGSEFRLEIPAIPALVTDGPPTSIG